MEKKYRSTNIYIINKELWAWAKYKASVLGFKSVSLYLFNLIEKEKQKEP